LSWKVTIPITGTKQPQLYLLKHDDFFNLLKYK